MVPGFNASRTPVRFLVFVELALALVAALGAAWWLASRSDSRRPWLVAGLVALVLVESVAVPYPGTVHRLDPGLGPGRLPLGWPPSRRGRPRSASRSATG